MANECQALLLSSLTNYYNKYPENKKKLITMISTSNYNNSSKFKISLRILDWFVTHYAKNKQIIYWIDDENNKVYFEYPEDIKNTEDKDEKVIRKFNLYYEYRAQLQSYTKMYFDPFRRHNRISFEISQNPSTYIETTVGQLNFFKWIMHNHVLEYINQNIEEIENHMGLYQKSIKNIINIPVPKKESKIFQITSNIPCIIRFD